MIMRKTFAALAAVVGCAAFAAGTWAVLAEDEPEGPVEIAWGEELCARCHMPISVASFATQVQLEDGVVLDFDDPGCMLSWLARNEAPVNRIWLHHATRDQWLLAADAGFIWWDVTPRGFGLAVVGASEPNAMGWDAAASHLATRGRTGQDD